MIYRNRRPDFKAAQLVKSTAQFLLLRQRLVWPCWLSVTLGLMQANLFHFLGSTVFFKRLLSWFHHSEIKKNVSLDHKKGQQTKTQNIPSVFFCLDRTIYLLRFLMKSCFPATPPLLFAMAKGFQQNRQVRISKTRGWCQGSRHAPCLSNVGGACSSCQLRPVASWPLLEITVAEEFTASLRRGADCVCGRPLLGNWWVSGNHPHEWNRSAPALKQCPWNCLRVEGHNLTAGAACPPF